MEKKDVGSTASKDSTDQQLQTPQQSSSTSNDSTDRQLIELHDKLEDLPISMMQFGSNLRSLYSVNQVTGQDESTKAFLEVRDNTRKSGLIYVSKVLPMTEEVVRSIGLFMDYFRDLDFDDWSECLGDIIEDVKKAQGYCEILKQMHNTIIIDLKKNEDKALVSIEMMNSMATEYKNISEKLLEDAKKDMDNAESWKNREWWNDNMTLGVSRLVEYVLGGSMSAKAETNANKKTAGAVAHQTNAQIAETAVALTTTHLIPAIKGFIEGLEVCSMFLTDTKERLVKMNNVAEKGAKKPYYKMMQNRSGEINTNTQRFLAITDMLRNNLAAIPTENDDKNFVDKWIEQEMLKFQKENNDSWKEIGRKANKILKVLME